MGTSVLPYRYRINGLIDTSKTAINNLELIGNSCATWITYDVQDGKWAVVINRAGNPVHAFDDNNIIGAIKLNGTGLTDQYNAVEVRFPHRDLNDQTDWVRIEIPQEDRLPNEPDNVLTMDIPMINEPIQAQIIGLIELKQARLDKVITFQSDYSKINLAAGEIVSVTNSVYGWTQKPFRIIRMEETDVDGAIVVEITALEYEANIYDLSDLYRYTRTNQDGILTQGALGTPSTPAVTKFEADANPRVEISSTTPDNTDPLNQTGIVEAMEFWISTTGTDYTLLGTRKPDTALTFEANTTVTFTYNNISSDFYVKTRCANSTTTGEFSAPASVLFAPIQVTDAITDSTVALDGSGNILNTLGMAGLMRLLNNLVAQINPTEPGGIYDKYNQTYQDTTGKDLSQATTAVEFTTVLDHVYTTTQCNAMADTTNPDHMYDSSASDPANVIFQVSQIGDGWDTLVAEVKTPLFQYSIDFKDQNDVTRTTSIYAQPAFAIKLSYNTVNDFATSAQLSNSTVDWNSNYNKVVYQAPAAGYYFVSLSLIPTYDLNMYWVRAGTDPNTLFPYNFVDQGAGASDTGITIRVVSN